MDLILSQNASYSPDGSTLQASDASDGSGHLDGSKERLAKVAFKDQPESVPLQKATIEAPKEITRYADTTTESNDASRSLSNLSTNPQPSATTEATSKTAAVPPSTITRRASHNSRPILASNAGPIRRLSFDVHPQSSTTPAIVVPSSLGSTASICMTMRGTTLRRESDEAFNTSQSQLRSLSESSTTGISTAAGGGGAVEKPKILVYPRKSVVASTVSISKSEIKATSMASITRDSVASVVTREALRIGDEGEMSSGGGAAVSQSSMHRSKSSWSVKGSQGLRSGVISSRSMGNLQRQARAAERNKKSTDMLGESEEWELGQKETIEAKKCEKLRLPEEQERPISTVGPIDDAYRENPDYYDYVMLSQRHASSNFITKIASADLVYTNEKTVVKIIGPYVLGDKIGKGAFGKVKEGICSETLQRVAVKIITKKRLRKVPNGVENALREIKQLHKLKHKNIITLIDVYCKVEDDEGNVGIFNWFSTIEDDAIIWTYDDGTEVQKEIEVLKWYLVFEYCPCSLQVLLEQEESGKLSPEQAHKYFVQMVDGLEYLHCQGIVHRDIKPGNMLITADGVLKISDFGVAEQFPLYVEGDLNCQAFSGTHQFLSPEITEGANEFSGTKVDIWAIGVTLYNMATGKYPFEFSEDGNLLELYDKITAGSFTFPPGLDEDLQGVIRGMLKKNPKTRFSIQDIRLHKWTQTLFPGNQKQQAPILSYPIPDSKEDSPVSNMFNTSKVTTSMELITPCKTTMIPYMNELYGEELTNELATLGKFKDVCDGEDAVSPVDSNASHTKSRKKSIKRFLVYMFQRKSSESSGSSPSTPKEAKSPGSFSPGRDLKSAQ